MTRIEAEFKNYKRMDYAEKRTSEQKKEARQSQKNKRINELMKVAAASPETTIRDRKINQKKGLMDSAGKIIKVIRKAKKIDQNTFKKEINISQSSLSKIENGLLELNIKTLYFMNKNLKISKAALWNIIESYATRSMKKMAKKAK